jgi:hypothetical protein
MKIIKKIFHKHKWVKVGSYRDYDLAIIIHRRYPNIPIKNPDGWGHGFKFTIEFLNHDFLHNNMPRVEFPYRIYNEKVCLKCKARINDRELLVPIMKKKIELAYDSLIKKDKEQELAQKIWKRNKKL